MFLSRLNPRTAFFRVKVCDFQNPTRRFVCKFQPPLPGRLGVFRWLPSTKEMVLYLLNLTPRLADEK